MPGYEWWVRRHGGLFGHDYYRWYVIHNSKLIASGRTESEDAGIRQAHRAVTSHRTYGDVNLVARGTG